jgi:hypothetical protein
MIGLGVRVVVGIGGGGGGGDDDGLDMGCDRIGVRIPVGWDISRSANVGTESDEFPSFISTQLSSGLSLSSQLSSGSSLSSQ